MIGLRNLLSRYRSDENGATAIEYGLIAALIGVGLIVGAKSMSGSINGMFTEVDGDIGEAFSSTSTSSPSP